ncbi:FUSC family protein [Dactylosporangium sp. NPDC049525]|uniref:FUSC family protein n=1 Tax=Dactylosporangium sp. NPDC049525 TaxID=3154730 RepID=UPI003425DB67
MPPWLAEVVRPRPISPPWPRMIRAPLVICLPLAVAMMTGHLLTGLPVAMGGLISSVVERGGPYPGRAKRLGTVLVLGSALGLTIGMLTYGRGWIAVAVIMVLALVSAVISAAGNVGSVTGMQLLLFAVLGTGPLGMMGPWWSVVGLFLAGAAWGTGLSMLGWLFVPHAPEQRSVAEAYRAVARLLRAIGTQTFDDERAHLTTALNTAFDEMLAARATVGGHDTRQIRLMAALNQTHQIVEAAITLAGEGTRPPPAAACYLDAVADTIQHTAAGHAPALPPATDTPGGRALHEALAGTSDVLAGGAVAARRPAARGHEQLRASLAAVHPGRLVRLFALRLVLCTGVAAVVSEVVAMQRSYWVILTVVVVLKPDFGSVFARGLQRGIGTVVGAVVGAALLATVPSGPLLLIPMAVLAFLLPYGFSLNYGLLATLLTPLVVLLIDLPSGAGWQLAQIRLVDTLVGCAIVLLLGYLPWPSSWHVDVAARFADTVSEVGCYLQKAFGERPAGRYLPRREADRRLSDLRTVFQQSLAEPARISRPVTAWYPAVVALERTLDAITATAVVTDRGAAPPTGSAVHQLVDAIDAIGESVRHAHPPPRQPLPTEPAARPVADAVCTLERLLWRPGDATA